MAAHASGGPGNENEYAILRQEILAIPQIENLVPSFVRTNRSLASFWSYIQPKFKTYRDRRTYISTEFTPLLDYLEFGSRPETTAPSPGIVSVPAPVSMDPSLLRVSTENKTGSHEIEMSMMTRNKRKVFIVHGRDNEAKQEVARFVSDLGLQPIILHEQASSGMTIIEKIERYTNEADFALVLYTACDQGRGVHESTVDPRNRARQNVVFEHGYLMAKLGRENVCALVKGEIETPNDISGVVYVGLDPFGGWKNSVITELRACGYSV